MKERLYLMDSPVEKQENFPLKKGVFMGSYPQKG